MYCCHKWKKYIFGPKKSLRTSVRWRHNSFIITLFGHVWAAVVTVTVFQEHPLALLENPEDATWARGKANKGLNTRSQLRKHTAWRARWCSLGCWTSKKPNSGSGVGGWQVHTQGVAHVGMTMDESRLKWLWLSVTKMKRAAETMRVEQNLGLVCEWRLQAVSPV